MQNYETQSKAFEDSREYKAGNVDNDAEIPEDTACWDCTCDVCNG